MAHRNKYIKPKDRVQYTKAIVNEAVIRNLKYELSVQFAASKYTVPERNLRNSVSYVNYIFNSISLDNL